MAESAATPLNQIFGGSSDEGSSSESTEPTESQATQTTDESSTEQSSSSEESKDEGDTQKSEIKSEGEPVTDEKKAAGEDDKSKKAEDDKSQPPDPYEKRWKDTAQWANSVNQQNQALQQQLANTNRELAILKKQVADPDYDPATDPALAGPSPEETATAALQYGKVVASREAAYGQFGKDQVNEQLNEFNQIFANNEMVQRHVLNHESPTYRALEILEDFKFNQKYGFKPTERYENIKKEVLADARKTLRKEIMDEIEAGATKKSKTTEGLSKVRGGNGTEKGRQDNTSPQTPLGQLFPN